MIDVPIIKSNIEKQNAYYSERFDDSFHKISEIEKGLKDIFTHDQKGFCILISGSLLSGRYDSTSDLDFVLLLDQDSQNSDIFEQLECFLLKQNLTAYDIAISKRKNMLWEFPCEDIDKRISYKSRFLYGDHLLWVDFQEHLIFLDQDLISWVCRNVLYRYAPLPPGKKINDIKYRPGGLRDVTRIRDLVHWFEYLEIGSTELLNQLSIFEKTAWYLLKNNPTNDCCQKVYQLLNQLEEFVIALYLPHFRNLFIKLRQMYREGGSSVSELEESYPQGPHNFMILFAALYPYYLEHSKKFMSLGDHYLALVCNKSLKNDDLRSVLKLNGFTWRNIFDQLLKHPNLSLLTIQELIQSPNQQTAKRARIKYQQYQESFSWGFVHAHHHLPYNQKNENEFLRVIQPNGTIDGSIIPFFMAHQRGEIHVTVDIFCITPEKKILLQKRSGSCYLFPNYFTLSAGGHVTYTQSILESAVCELFEELGILIQDQSRFVLLNIDQKPLPLFYELVEYHIDQTQTVKLHRFQPHDSFMSMEDQKELNSNFDHINEKETLVNYILNQELTYYYVLALTKDEVSEIKMNSQEVQKVVDVDFQTLRALISDENQRTDTFYVLNKYNLIDQLEKNM